MKSFAFALLVAAGAVTASSSLQTLLDRSHDAKALHSPTLRDAGSAARAPAPPNHLVNAMLGSSDSFVRNAADADFSMRMRKRSFVGEPAENRSVGGRKEHSAQDLHGRADSQKKRWIISPTIIQDDTPFAPPVGSSINLNTPVAALIAPSFPPRPPTLPSSPPVLPSAALPTSALPSPSPTFVAAAVVVPSSAPSLPASPSVTPPASSSALAVASAPVARLASQVIINSQITSTASAVKSPVTTPFYRTRHAPQRLASNRKH